MPEARLRSPEALVRGRTLYERHCALCHGERGDGRGQRSAGFEKAPARLDDTSWRQRTTPRRVFFVIREGLQGTPMPAWPGLSEEETWDVVAYVLTMAGDATLEDR